MSWLWRYGTTGQALSMVRLEPTVSWFRNLPPWLILPAVAVALGGLWAWLRRKPRAPGPVGLSPEDGDRRIAEIRTATEAEAERIAEHGKEKRDKIKDKWGGSLCLLVCAVLSLQACAHGLDRPDAPAWPMGHPEPSLSLSDGCEYADEDHQLVQCPAPLFASSLLQMADVEDSLAVTAQDLAEARAVSSIRESVALARVRAAELRVDDAERGQWIWGSVGIVIGAVGAGLLVGFAGR